LSPCHGRSSGQTQILSRRCVVRRLPESSNNYMLLRSTFLSYPTTFHTCKIIISSYLLATVEVVNRPKSYQVDVLCVDYPNHRTITCGYEVLYYLIPLLYSLVENYIILSPCHNRSSGLKSHQVDVLCIDYPSHQIVTCGYELPCYLIPLLSLLVRELHHLVSLPR
jgi:hypothetical protein